MQNASITVETKRPCQEWGVVTGAANDSTKCSSELQSAHNLSIHQASVTWKFPAPPISFPKVVITGRAAQAHQNV